MSCPFVLCSEIISKCQSDISQIMDDIQKAGIPFQTKAQWKVISFLNAETKSPDVHIIGPHHWNLSGHKQLTYQKHKIRFNDPIFKARDAISALGGYFEDTRTIERLGFERAPNGKINFVFMGHNLKNTINGPQNTWALPRVLKDIHDLPKATGLYKIGSHSFPADGPKSVIKLALILSAPKTPLETRKNTKPLASIHRVWTFSEVAQFQKEILGVEDSKD